MKVQLIVVQGKPEGKVIPLNGPVFKIGRGEGCHLRPNSELVSREHAEFRVQEEILIVRDLGSRNGTLVNNKPVEGPTDVKNGDLVQVGPLTFAVSITGAPQPAAKPVPAKGTSLDGVSGDEIDSWLIGDKDNPAPDSSSELYKGDTITIGSFNKPKPDVQPATPPPKQEVPVEEAVDELPEDDVEDALPQGLDDEDEEEDEIPEEFIDESNPFYAAKKQAQDAAKKPESKDSSEAANDILRKLMERRRSR
jgi:predicted component of type VI protein secretion system